MQYDIRMCIILHVNNQNDLVNPSQTLVKETSHAKSNIAHRTSQTCQGNI